MRCSRGGRAAVLLTVALTTVLLVGESPASATAAEDVDDDGGKGGKDIAVPAVDVTSTELGPTGETATTLAATALDDFRYDRQLTTGYARDICYGRMRPGTAKTFFELQRRFGGSAGTLYACRERWNAAEEPDCNGTLVDPNTNPYFFSTCWSNHAQGRALDLMSTTTRGNAVVNWLLAPDAGGNYSANARRLGVQQILWRDHCWNTDDDRGVLSVKHMRQCGIGHFDHVHIDLTLPGAMARTSYWGGTPRIEPKKNGVLWWDRNTGRRTMQSWFNYRPTGIQAPNWKLRWDVAVAGDFASDRVSDDLFVWDRDTGTWVVASWTGSRWVTTAKGRWARRWDRVIPGDWDGDRREDDLLQWDGNTGSWQVRSWSGAGYPRGRGGGAFPVRFDEIYVGDFDEDNRLDEMFLRDRDTGRFLVLSWSAFAPTVKWSGTWARRFDQFVIGDWDSDGELNDMLRRDRTTGAWGVLSWHGFRPTGRRSGSWPARYKQIVAADLDAEGRIDDMVVRAPRTGQSLVIEWHYYRWRLRDRMSTAERWDHIIAGQWG
jgi:hypothetical protein